MIARQIAPNNILNVLFLRKVAERLEIVRSVPSCHANWRHNSRTLSDCPCTPARAHPSRHSSIASASRTAWRGGQLAASWPPKASSCGAVWGCHPATSSVYWLTCPSWICFRLLRTSPACNTSSGDLMQRYAAQQACECRVRAGADCHARLMRTSSLPSRPSFSRLSSSDRKTGRGMAISSRSASMGWTLLPGAGARRFSRCSMYFRICTGEQWATVKACPHSPNEYICPPFVTEAFISDSPFRNNPRLGPSLSPAPKLAADFLLPWLAPLLW